MKQEDVFRACSTVLDTALIPLHYKDLTRNALAMLGQKDYLPFKKRAEDVRQWLWKDSRFDVIYTKKPLCYMAKRRWFAHMQPDLFNVDAKADPIRIEGSVASGIEGAYVTLMRSPHMLAKTDMHTRCKGLVIEQHVTDWFKEQYPEFFLAASNAGQWEVPAKEDFRLRLPDGSVIAVDVASPSRDGTYRLRKQTTMMHLYATIAPNGRDVLLVGTKLGKDWTHDIEPENTNDPKRLIVWLNCLKAGIPHDELRQIATRRTTQ